LLKATFLESSTLPLINPQNILKPKISHLLFGHHMRREVLLFTFLTSERQVSQAFWQHQAHKFPTMYGPTVNFYSKWVVNSFFFYFLRNSCMSKTTQWMNGKVPKKKFVLPIECWIFIFFPILFLLMVLHDVIFNVTIEI
jgi:hypothetical protein